jgi:hypothetical protein
MRDDRAIEENMGVKKWRFATQLIISETFFCESPLLHSPSNHQIDMSFRGEAEESPSPIEKRFENKNPAFLLPQF